MSDPYPGAVTLVTDNTWPNLFAAALSAVPSAPLTWADLAGLILPYGPAPLSWDGWGSINAQASLRLMLGEAVFTHPQATGTLTVAGIAVGYAGESGWLLAVQTIDPPVSTYDVGETLTVPVTLIVLADPSWTG